MCILSTFTRDQFDFIGYDNTKATGKLLDDYASTGLPECKINNVECVNQLLCSFAE